jgi:ribosome-binding factor A
MSRLHHTGAVASQRMLRVGELVRHALSELLSRGDISDPDLEGKVITVPEVKMSPDLKLATVFVMPLGGKDAKAVVEALDRHRKELRAEIARKVNLKNAADLRFRVDESFDEAARIDALLRTTGGTPVDGAADEPAEDE